MSQTSQKEVTLDQSLEDLRKSLEAVISSLDSLETEWDLKGSSTAIRVIRDFKESMDLITFGGEIAEAKGVRSHDLKILDLKVTIKRRDKDIRGEIEKSIRMGDFRRKEIFCTEDVKQLVREIIGIDETQYNSKVFRDYISRVMSDMVERDHAERIVRSRFLAKRPNMPDSKKKISKEKEDEFFGDSVPKFSNGNLFDMVG